MFGCALRRTASTGETTKRDINRQTTGRDGACACVRDAYVRVHACARACVSVCVRTCVRVCKCMRVSSPVCVCVWVRACVRAVGRACGRMGS